MGSLEEYLTLSLHASCLMRLWTDLWLIPFIPFSHAAHRWGFLAVPSPVLGMLSRYIGHLILGHNIGRVCCRASLDLLVFGMSTADSVQRSFGPWGTP